MTTGRKPGQPYRWELPEREIARLYREGIGMEPLSDLYCVSPPTIRRCLVRQGEAIRPHRARKRLPPSIVQDYATHRSLAKVGALHGVSGCTIKQRLIEMGVEINQSGGPNNPTGKSGPRHAGSPKHRRGGI